MGRLVIDGNKVYEIDEDCLKKKKQKESEKRRQREYKRRRR